MPIYKNKDKKGRVIDYNVRINYQDNTGRHRQLTRKANTAEEAKELERQLSYEVKQKESPLGIHFDEVLRSYFAKKKYEVKQTSYRKSEQYIRLYVTPFFTGTRMDKWTLRDMEKWKDSVRQKDIALLTKQAAYKEFTTLINYAITYYGLKENLLKKSGNFKDPHQMKTEMEYYTYEEFKQFIDIAHKHAKAAESLQEWHYYVFFNIAFFTGLRKGEMHALTWEDIKDGYLTVSKSITQNINKTDLLVPPKNKSSYRTLQLPKRLIAVLDDHYNRCSKLDGFTKKSFVCGITRPIRDNSIRKCNIRYSAEAGIKRIRIHDFRHSHVSLLANEGINIQEIARRLGHSQIEVTWNTYSHLYPREEEKAVEILDGL